MPRTAEQKALIERDLTIARAQLETAQIERYRWSERVNTFERRIEIFEGWLAE